MVNAAYDTLLRQKQEADAKAKAMRDEATKIQRAAIADLQAGCGKVGHIFAPAEGSPFPLFNEDLRRKCQVCHAREEEPVVQSDITGRPVGSPLDAATPEERAAYYEATERAEQLLRAICERYGFKWYEDRTFGASGG